ncbi:hypothetical protein V8V91_10680 [Algoriphagus halophilus]|uniref:hypothetical protein n=1 Tax=Algoriphagus halophilus TaxID=226505 RepID=UPI00358F7FFE
MKKPLLILFLLLGFFSNYCFASDTLEIPKKHRFQIGIRYFNVHNNFVNQSNVGSGIYGTYSFPLFNKLGIDGKVILGTDWMIGEGGFQNQNGIKIQFGVVLV